MGFLKSTRGKIIIGAIAAIVLIAIVVLIIIISVNGAWPLTRDIALVALAFLSFIPILALVYAIIEVARLANMLKKELGPIVTDLKETTQSIRDTTKTASDLTVKPAIKTASVLVGLSQTMNTFLGEGTARKRKEDRRRRNAKEAAERAEAAEADAEMEDAHHGHR